MSDEPVIQSEVEALRSRFQDTKTLYREVCALLFFRHGITPTTNKLYQFVRKGSMSAPAEALAAFWQELRSKARVEIDHPDLPDSLRTLAGEAIAGLWQAATAAARSELAAVRIEVQAQVEQAQQAQREANQSAVDSQARAAAFQGEIAAAAVAHGELREELEAERREHASTAALLSAARAQIANLQADAVQARSDFGNELAQARLAVEAADERAAGAQRRALMEIDQERTARTRAEKTQEQLRAQLQGTESRLRDSEIKSSTELASLRATGDRQVETIAELRSGLAGRDREVSRLRQELTEQQRQTVEALAQAHAASSLLERFQPDAAPRRPKKVRSEPPA